MKGCCNLCAWWSVIGAFTYFTLAMMVARKNWSVIMEKFHIKVIENVTTGADGSIKVNPTLAKELGDVEHKMWMMVLVMMLSSGLCFFLGWYFAKREKLMENVKQKVGKVAME